MVRGKKISKKRLKQPDEFVSLTEQVLLSAVAHRRKLILGGAVLAVLVLAVVFSRVWEKRNEKEASLKFDLAMETYQAVSSPYRSVSPAETKEAITKLDDILQRFPHTTSGRLSRLYKGNLHLKLGEFDEAIKAYEEFLAESVDEKLYMLFGLEALGYAYEGKKEYERAIGAYEKISAMGESFTSKGTHLNIGRCYEKLGNMEKALEYYKSFLEGSKKSLMTDLVLRKVSLLEK